MPDDLIPEAAPSEPAGAVADPPADPSSSEPTETVDPYDEHIGLLAETDEPEPAQDDTPEVETDPEQPKPDKAGEKPKSVQLDLSEDEQKVLNRAKVEPSQLAGLSRDQVRMVAEILRQDQAEQDNLGAQLGRLRQQLEEKAPEQPEAEPDREAPESTDQDIAQEVDDLMEKLAESYDEDIKPLGDVLKSYATRTAAAERQVSHIASHLSAVDSVADLVTEMVLTRSFDSLAENFPSLSKPEVRARATKRFWTEWATGTYADHIAEHGILSAMNEAAKSAAKVLFGGTEKEAVVQLVEQNRARVSGQPKTPSRAQRKGPSTEEDIYDEAFKESGLADAIAKELAS